MDLIITSFSRHGRLPVWGALFQLNYLAARFEGPEYVAGTDVTVKLRHQGRVLFVGGPKLAERVGVAVRSRYLVH